MLRCRAHPTIAMIGGDNRLDPMGSTGEATEQDMLAPDCSLINPRLLG